MMMQDNNPMQAADTSLIDLDGAMQRMVPQNDQVMDTSLMDINANNLSYIAPNMGFENDQNVNTSLIDGNFEVAHDELPQQD